jgi:DNA relaxase NicK
LQTLPALSLRRCDIALDTVGRQVTHESVVGAYRVGMFAAPGRPGRPPKCQRIESERPEDGRTVYIGSRENDKFFRGYEKGLKLASQSGGTLTHIEGVPVGDMYRCELELKAKSGALPDDLIDCRDQYFAGAYPYLQHVLHDVVPEVMVIDRRLAPRINLDRMLEHIRTQYGSTLFTALTVHHGDIGAVWERICGAKHNEDLLRAGALLMESQ